jgi:DNA-binding CsgD family transcriptional regulator/PAS domain-containing protein
MAQKKGAAMSDAGNQRTHREMAGVLNLLELPIALVDLADFTIVAASSALLQLLGLSESEFLGRRVTELYTREDAAAAIGALSVLRDGVVDFYRSERHLDARFARAAKITAWGRSVKLGDRHFALVEASGGSKRAASPFTEYFGREPPAMALGTADGDWVIRSMSSDSVELFGVAPEALVGQSLLSLVAEEDAPGLVAAEQMVNQAMSAAAKSVRMRDKEGAWQTLCCVLTELSVSNSRYFMLIPVDAAAVASQARAAVPVASSSAVPIVEPPRESPTESPGGPASRVAELERHLWRIAAEVEASGVLRQVHDGPDLSSLRELGSLSAKQWEVLSRLLQGKRVKIIASEMFISESTVRNHLSAIFEQFGVHSQAELLAVLRESDQPPG